MSAHQGVCPQGKTGNTLLLPSTSPLGEELMDSLDRDKVFHADAFVLILGGKAMSVKYWPWPS